MNLNPDRVPATIDEAVTMLHDGLNEQDREAVLKHPPESVHFTLGMYLRNNWSLWDKDTPMHRDFRERFKLFGHGDDISGMILKSVWAKVHGLDVAAVQATEAETYRRHWLAHGVNPETGEWPAAPAPQPEAREQIVVVPDDGTGRAYDTLLRAPGVLKDLGDLHVVVKEKATVQGNPSLLLTFTVVLPNGHRAPVQTVCTLRNFLNAAQILRAKYPTP